MAEDDRKLKIQCRALVFDRPSLESVLRSMREEGRMERRWVEVQVEVAETEEVRGGGAEERRREAGEEERAGEIMP